MFVARSLTLLKLQPVAAFFLPLIAHCGMSSEAFVNLPEVDIDPDGRFKYILIRATDTKTKEKKMIVRGYKWAAFHADIFEDVEKKVHGTGVDVWCVGGGRILHTSQDKKLAVFGYSQGYGKADHTISVGLLKKVYPDYTITCSDEGY
ncbi:14 kDa phosphohistidine phosphatase-like [Cloeon dipterum]|uniref:14 kDa phosphohistidine phosphatase-like n=1 Tax=Cloeon dipterum TaxID=197152 RepID=UPI0032206C26